MRAFRAGEIDVLVATTVIEVGVDVPNATVMVVEDADRFGLSQLHQLRGRVGRGGDRSYCFLFADPSTEDGEQRLEAMAASTDGFALAEKDLEIRGSGEVFGERQSGFSDLKLGRIPRDEAIVMEARAVAEADPRRRSRARRPRAAPRRGAATSSATTSTSCSSREPAIERSRGFDRGDAPRAPARRARRRSGAADEGHRPRGDVLRARRPGRARRTRRCSTSTRARARSRSRRCRAARRRRSSSSATGRASAGDPGQSSRSSADDARSTSWPRDVGRFVAGGPPARGPVRPRVRRPALRHSPTRRSPAPRRAGGARLARAGRDRQRRAAPPASGRRPARALDRLGADLRRYAF